ncbi:MAG: hypothetical protein JJU09_00400 [Rhodobacteraceae bacterium]|nr:hypothetical protein [Paracoccaceae bacterium]
MKPDLRTAPGAMILTLAMGGMSAGATLAEDSRWRDCRTCHTVEAPDGTVLARGGRSGPNLYGIAGAPLAGDGAFGFYSDDLRAAAQTGARWNADNFVAYMTDPDAFLRNVTGNPDASSGMHVELRSGAREVFDYLRNLSE